MKIDLEAFRKHEEQKIITCREHANGELLIWNYTPRAQYEGIWDDITIQARGLITDLEGNIKARPFRKFFNYSQYEGEELSIVGAKVTEKYDGSLGILYNDGEHWAIATRGSFQSEQAIRGTGFLNQYISEYGTSWIDPKVTYLFEIIYPENRIVVDYAGAECLILLAAFDIETGEEVDIRDVDFPRSYKAQEWADFNDIAELFDMENDKAEGLVVRFANGLRLKIKWDEYVRLHRLVTMVSSKDIWDMLKNNTSFDEILDRVPDEFYDWVKTVRQDLLVEHGAYILQGFDAYRAVCNLPTKKEQALALQQNFDRNICSIAFAFLDGKTENANMAAWKFVKPEYQRPFRTDIDA